MAHPHQTPAPSPETRGRLRVALYSHDALGLGHIRRNLAIAHALSAMDPAPDILLLTGAPEACAHNRPAHCDIVSLPALSKDRNGCYLGRHLSIEERQIHEMRRSILGAALSTFLPDVLIVDKHPRGFRGELEPSLDLLRARGTRIVLGLRDILDDAHTSRREWQDERCPNALRRWYDQVWVYGDREVHDLAAELGLSPAHTVHTGYLANGRCPTKPTPRVDQPYVLGMVGGGADGAELAETFARATMPRGHRGVLVTGPQMPADDIARIAAIAADNEQMSVHTYVEDTESLLAGASAVVGMGGYNTVCEALAAHSKLLVIPRVTPRQEQLVRARLLADAGHLDYMLPQHLTPASLAHWLRDAVQSAPRALPERPGPRGIDLDGLARLPELLIQLMAPKEGVHVA